MITLNETLETIRAEQKKSKKPHPALMTHVVLGYPTMEKSIEIVLAMADAGAKLIELQIPFSDPMADGPTIMAANEAALRQGVKVKDCFRAAEKLAQKTDVPLLFMSYYNILYRYSEKKHKDVDVKGVSDFCQATANAGVQGLIVPDVPPEESGLYWSLAADAGLSPIPIVTPVSTQARLEKIQEVVSGGFIYCVTTAGTTGARSELPPQTPQYLKKIRKHFKQPLAVGFGISSREQVSALSGLAEIAIVGSAVIQKIKESSEKNAVQSVKKFLKTLG